MRRAAYLQYGRSGTILGKSQAPAGGKAVTKTNTYTYTVFVEGRCRVYHHHLSVIEFMGMTDQARRMRSRRGCLHVRAQIVEVGRQTNNS